MLIDPTSVCHVVRRFGVVGGMESYVWHLAHAQINLGFSVSVIAESVDGEPDPAITIHQVSGSKSGRRWRQMLWFRDAVRTHVDSLNKQPRPIIHSHERNIGHDVTTFHGPPMSPTWLERIWSRRVKAWQEMELAEICGPQKPFVVPVSEYLGRKLRNKYPSAATRVLSPVYPGVDRSISKLASTPTVEGRRLLFVGVDWKRKGLPLVLDIYSSLKILSKGWSLDVVGPSGRRVQNMVKKAGACFQGWQKRIDYTQYELLILPSRVEPFGMVVSEARAYGCRVVCSDQVGAAELHGADDGLFVVPINASTDVWVENIVRGVEQTRSPYSINRSWGKVASEYNDNVYSKIVGEVTSQ